MPSDTDLSRIRLSPEAAALFARVQDTATAVDRGEAHSVAAEAARQSAS